MDEVFKFLDDHAHWFFLGAFVWTFFGFGVIWLQSRKLRPIMPKSDDPDVVFFEKGASGKSHKKGTGFGGASNCLTVIVTREKLAITTYFPFTIIAHKFDMEHLVPLEKVGVLSYKKRKLLGDKLLLEIPAGEEERREYTLQLKNSDEFVEALRAGSAFVGSDV